MYNRRNKLMLNLAKTGQQSDVSTSEDLTKLLQNTFEVLNNEGCTASSITNEHVESVPYTDNNGFFGETVCDHSSGFQLFGDDTFKEIIEDLHTSENIDSIFCEQPNDDSMAFDADVGNSRDQNVRTVNNTLVASLSPLPSSIEHSPRSLTPVPSDCESFTSSPTNELSYQQNSASLRDDTNNQIEEVASIIPSVASPIVSRNQSPFELTTSVTTSAAEASSECSSPSSATGRKRTRFFIDNSKKKRKSDKNNWLDTKRKFLVNHGKHHLSRGGKVQPEKKLRPTCENCKSKCHTKFTIQDRKRIFDLFWGLGDHVKQWQFIAKYTKQFTKKRITTDHDSKRNYSVHYFLPTLTNSNNVKCSTKVCKTMFKNTLSISNQFIQSGIDKYNVSTGTCENDKRGLHDNKKKVLTDEVIKGVCDHVKSFCPVESHYTRKESNKLYLDSDLDFTKMFKMYNEWVLENNINDRVSTLRQYRDVVNTHMNIGFFVPKKDQCDICVANKNKPQNEGANDTFTQHMVNKNIARSLKTQDKNLTQCNPNLIISAATFDFQKILCTPHGDTSSFYYKRKLSVFNFTIFDMGLKKGICYVWDETTARRGSNEVASCLYDYIKKVVESGTKDVRLWSDNCGGQNRNRTVFSMYLYAVRKLNVSICHRFLEKGHTQQEGDSVHALIERSSKKKTINTPQEWYTCIRWCKVTGDPYEVIEVTQEDIFDFKSNLGQYLWLKNSINEKVKWNQVREIKVEPENPNIIYYKYDLNETQSMSIDCSRRATTRRYRNNSEELKKAYTETLSITLAKYKDLMSLCDQNLIPPRYHDFYKNLKHNGTDVTASDDDDA